MTSRVERLSSRRNTSNSGWHLIKAGLAKVGSGLLRWLVSPQEPVISQHRNREGQPTWKVYDPYSRQTYWFSSEKEVRQWLDSYYSMNGSHTAISRPTAPPQSHQKAETLDTEAMPLEVVRQQLEDCWKDPSDR
ncbi:hypothetical protein [Vacuolonema iberomarrocanum]|uniref:hypothetical protein n=1 Tax=Vacuolonema iberomarrocanum TaxID=3454632 RepID=UPI0019E4F358|nr:hypothetical protein [filamentous cyanobacterium LEGE 07170]